MENIASYEESVLKSGQPSEKLGGFIKRLRKVETNSFKNNLRFKGTRHY